MDSGDIDPGGPYEVSYREEEPLVGESYVEYYALEGGTLTYDPNDDPNIGVIDEPDSSTKVGLSGNSGVRTGLKEYKDSVAVNPTVCFGSITAVPDPGYVFVSWNNGANYSPKLYIWGAMSGTATAYFEKMPTVEIHEEPLVGESYVEYYALEGGTLTYDPNDDPNIGVKMDIPDNSDKVELSGYSSGVRTGLKEYKDKVAVNPTVCFGSITAVPDPGYVFVSWNNGVNYSPKLYIWGAMSGKATAYFEKETKADKYEVIRAPEPDINGYIDPTAKTTDEDGESITSEPPAMSVYAHNAMNGKVTLAQGKSVSLDGFAVLEEIDYTSNVSGKVNYESSNAKVATVNESGKVIASKKNTGTAKITISSVDNPNCKKVVSVKVIKKAKFHAPKKIKTINLKKQYKANATKQIAVKVLSWDPTVPSDKNFVVSVYPTKRANVDPTTNKVTFTAKGKVKVTVKSTVNPKASKTVTVSVK